MVSWRRLDFCFKKRKNISKSEMLCSYSRNIVPNLVSAAKNVCAASARGLEWLGFRKRTKSTDEVYPWLVPAGSNSLGGCEDSCEGSCGSEGAIEGSEACSGEWEAMPPFRPAARASSGVNL